MKNRVVISGYGVVTPFGEGKDKLLTALEKGESCFSTHRIQSNYLVEEQWHTLYCGKITQWDTRNIRFLDPRRVQRTPEFVQWIMMACNQALQESGVEKAIRANKKCAVIISSGLFHIVNMENFFSVKNMEPVTPATIPGIISAKLNINGPAFSVSAGEASALYALGTAFDLIRSGRQEIILVGGGFQLNNFIMEHYIKLGYFSSGSHRNGIPIENNDDVPIPSEGAGFFILESDRSAEERNADIYGEIKGFGMSNTPFTINDTVKVSRSIQCAMTEAINDAALTADQIDFVCADSNGHAAKSRAEATAFDNIFSEYLRDIPITSINSVTGDTINTGGFLNVMNCLMSFGTGVVLPANHNSINTKRPKNKRKKHMKIGVANSISIGGSSASIVLGGGPNDPMTLCE